MNKKDLKIPEHPGKLLEKKLAASGITQKQFARRVKMATPHVSRFICGKTRASLRLALRLEKVLDVPARKWLIMQMNYDLSTVNNKRRTPR